VLGCVQETAATLAKRFTAVTLEQILNMQYVHFGIFLIAKMYLQLPHITAYSLLSLYLQRILYGSYPWPSK